MTPSSNRRCASPICMNASLEVGAATAEEILAGTAQLPARSLRSLSDRLVFELIPLLSAEAAVLSPHLEGGLRDALDADHRAVRLLTERLETLADAEERSRHRSRPDPRHRALSETKAALTMLVAHQRAALRQLEATLPASDRERLAGDLQAATTAAYERTLLVVSPVVPPTASTVFRKRPDLKAARAVSVAAIRRTWHGGGR